MKVSINTIKQFINFELPSADTLLQRINAQLGGVEETINLEEKYNGIVLVRVVSAEQHPNADKLTVCKIDDGDEVKGVERDEDGYVQIVCGAPNVDVGMIAVWLPPGVTVPASYGTTDPFVLTSRELRGVTSNGMLAAADELDIGSDHGGIISLTVDDLPADTEDRALTPGQDFAELFGLDDMIVDIENKMFTHRPDCFGQLGVAREITGISHRQFSSPEWYVKEPEFMNGEGLDLEVFNDAPNGVPRFMAVAIQGVEVKASPFWFQCELVRLGAKPINNIVDITNYFMLLTGQPLHAYDYDKLRGWRLGARFAHAGEQLTLLNNKTYELDESDIVIVDSEGPIGLGGVMGGLESEVSDTTQNIVLECATFDMYTVRRTSMRHGLFTDAVTRFNKGQSPLQNPTILAQALTCLLQLTGGEVASSTHDAVRTLPTLETITLDVSFINARLGLALTSDEIRELLTAVEVGVESAGKKTPDTLQITPPFWRTDLEMPEDIVEEVGRLYGFDKLPRELPYRSIAPTPESVVARTKTRIRESLSKAGANELLTYSFVHERVMKRAEQDVTQAFQLSNALSPELQYYRLSVLPSLLDNVHQNIKSGHDEFVLFEIGKGHNKKYHADDDNGLPREINFVDMVYTSRFSHDGAPYYYMQRIVSQLACDLGVTLLLKLLDEPHDYPVTAPFDFSRSAIVETSHGDFIGMIGELKQSVLASFKLPLYTAAATLDLEAIQSAVEREGHGYRPLSKYPSITNDISLRTSVDVPYSALHTAVKSGCDESRGQIRCNIIPLTIYREAADSQEKTTTFRVECVSDTMTLTDAHLKPILAGIAKKASAECGAVLV